MSSRDITTHVSAAPKATNRAKGRLAGGLRTALLVVVAAAVLYLAYGFGRLFAEWRQLGQPPPPPDSTAATMNSMAAVMPLAGQWSFADLDWDLKSQATDPEQIDAQFESLAASPAPDDIDQLPDVSEELFKLAQMLRVQPVERAGNQVYRLDRHDWKGLLVVRQSAVGPKVVALAAAFPQQGGQWQLVELTPRPATGNALAAAAHLLPLPDNAQRSGGRFADDGSLLLELVTLNSNADKLIAAWKESGWEVRPSGLGEQDDFSYLCARGEEVIYAWSANPRGSLQTLMLVRSPSDADTSP